jgi:O-acetylserine/cysteine efflux transporter
MAFFYGLSQVFSRYIKDLDVKFTNSFMGLVGFIILIIFSQIFEGNIIGQTKKVEASWLACSYVCWNDYFNFGTHDDVLSL